jgi:hypothetical protein
MKWAISPFIPRPQIKGIANALLDQLLTSGDNSARKLPSMADVQLNRRAPVSLAKMTTSNTRLLSWNVFATVALLASSIAPAAEISLADVTWTPSGSAGLISGTYQSPGDVVDLKLGSSATGNGAFGYISTFGVAAAMDGMGNYVQSPLVAPLNLDTTLLGGTPTSASRVVSSSFSAGAGDSLTMHFNYVSTDGIGFNDFAWARLVKAGTTQTSAWLFTAQSGNNFDNDGTGDYVPGKLLNSLSGASTLSAEEGKVTATLTGAAMQGGMPGGSSTNWGPLGAPEDNGSYGDCWNGADRAITSCGSTGWITSEFSFAKLLRDQPAATYFIELGVSNLLDTAWQSALAFDVDRLNGAGLPLYGVAAIPEPDTYALMLAGICMVGFVRRRRRGWHR